MPESLGVAVLDLTTDDSRMRSGLSRAESHTKGAFSRMLGQAAHTAVGIGAYFAAVNIGKMFVAPIKMAGDFQQTLTVLQAVSHATDGQLKQLSAQAIRLGADIHLPAVSAKDAATAMLELSKGGLSVHQVMQSVHATLLLGTAAQIDFATAANVVTQTLTAFKIPATEAARVVDLFAGAANASVVNVSDITAAMTMSAQSFHALKVPVQDAATAIAVMAQGGQKGTVAGASLSIMMQRLANPTKKAAEAMKAMGVNVFDSHGRFIGIRGAIEAFTPALDKMSTKQKLATESVIAGARGQRAMNILMAGGVAQFDAMHRATTRVGEAQRLANAQTAGFNGAMSALRSTVETLALKLGLELLPKATQFARFLTQVAGAKSFTVAIKLIIAGGVSVAKGLFDQIDQALFGTKAKEVPILRKFNIGGNVRVDPGLVAEFSASMSAAIATINWADVGTKIGTAISKSVKLTNDVMNGMLAWANTHSGQMAEIGAVIGLKMISKLLDPSFWVAHWQLIGGIVLSVATTVFAPARFALLGVRLAEGAFSLFGATAGKVILAGLERLPGVLGRWAPSFARALGAAIEGAVTFAVAAALRLTAEVAGAISRGFGKLGGIVKTVFLTGIVGVIGGAIGAAAGKAVDLATAVANAIKTLPGKLAGLGGDLGGRLIAAIGEAAASASSAAYNAAVSLASRFLEGLAGLPGRAASYFNPFGGGGSGKGQSAGTGGRGARGAGGGGGGTGGGGNAGLQTDAFNAGQSLASKWIDGISKGLANYGPRIGASLYDTVIKAGEHGGQAVAKVTEATTRIFDAWANNVKTRVAATFDNARAKIEAEFAKAQAKLDAWKTKMTPTEALLASMQAKAALAQVENAVTNAKAALAKLDADFSTNWAKLLADQAANMAKLKAIQAGTETDAAIAGHEFDKTLGSAVGDPLAIGLLNARKALDTAKQMYAEHKISQAELFAAQDAYDVASLAAQNDTDATKLLADYDTWQNLLKQSADGLAGIAAQETTDAEARKAAQDQYGADRYAAQVGVWTALQDLQTFNLGLQADKERIAHDAQFEVLKAALKRRHDRTLVHIGNVEHAWDLHFKAMIKQAHEDGKTFGDAYVDAIDELSKPGGKLENSILRVANLVKKYLKLNSPAEAGPLSTLDTWWKKFDETLVSGMGTKKITDVIGSIVSPNLNPALAGGLMSGYASDKTTADGMGAGASPVTLTQNFNHTPADADPVAIGATASWMLRNLRT